MEDICFITKIIDIKKKSQANWKNCNRFHSKGNWAHFSSRYENISLKVYHLIWYNQLIESKRNFLIKVWEYLKKTMESLGKKRLKKQSFE